MPAVEDHWRDVLYEDDGSGYPSGGYDDEDGYSDYDYYPDTAGSGSGDGRYGDDDDLYPAYEDYDEATCKWRAERAAGG